MASHGRYTDGVPGVQYLPGPSLSLCGHLSNESENERFSPSLLPPTTFFLLSLSVTLSLNQSLKKRERKKTDLCVCYSNTVSRRWKEFFFVFSSVSNLASSSFPESTTELNFWGCLVLENTNIFPLNICFLSCYQDRSVFFH